MTGIFTKEFWLKAWDKEKKSDTYNVHKGFSTPEYWDNAAGSYDRDKKELQSRRLEKLLDGLAHSGLLFEGMDVLDIGCGTGTLATALARHGAKVTALDFSAGMLEKFRQKITPDIQKNITIVCEDWHAVDIRAKKWKKQFDLVIAFMSPGVAGPESFFKLMACSRNGCAVRGWAAKRHHPVLSALWEKIMGVPLEDKPQSILYKINLLFSMGMFPDICFDTVEWEQTVTVTQEFDSQMAFFKKVSRKSPAELEAVIGPYLSDISCNQRIVRKHKGLTATAIWKMDSATLG